MEENQDQTADNEENADTQAEASSEQATSEKQAEAPNEALEKSKEMGQKALNEAKEATQKAGAAFMTLFKDPLDGQAKALEGFSEKNALAVGIVFVVAFVIIGVIGVSQLIGAIGNEMDMLMGGGGFVSRAVEVGFGTQVKIGLVLATLPIFLASCYYAVEKWVADVKDVGLNRALFLASMVFIPMTFLFLVLSILGFFNSYILSALVTFVSSTTFLLTHSTLVDVYKLSTRQSVLLTPATLMVASMLTGIVGNILG